jgi:hypothetical protein
VKLAKISEFDKKQIISAAKKMKNANKIRKHLQIYKYTRQQIAAVLAWITMGKY